jgi:hypothetical protein
MQTGSAQQEKPTSIEQVREEVREEVIQAVRKSLSKLGEQAPTAGGRAEASDCAVCGWLFAI